MNHPRETIYAALFALVSAAAGFKTTSRRYKPWSEYSADQQPVLSQVQRWETPVQKTGVPASWKLDVDLVVYVNSTGNSDTIASSLLNPILDAVTSLFDPVGGVNPQTLGGLVHVARISGKIETDEGVLGDQAFAIIPVEIIVY